MLLPAGMMVVGLLSVLLFVTPRHMTGRGATPAGPRTEAQVGV
jgi:hypothetical protein